FVNFAGIQDGQLAFNFSNEAGFPSFQNSYAQFYVSAVLGIILFFYSFTLPNCEINKSSEKRTLSDALGLKAFALFKEKKMAIFFIFSMFLGVSLQITNGYANPFITSFKEIPEFANTWGSNNANALISLSQVSETLCILLIPFFLKRFGIKKVMLMAMFAWFLRFGLFGLGNPGTGVWMFVLSMIVYGIAFDFFNVSGSLFVDNETDKSIRSSAQGVFMMMTNGFGATIGMLAAGEIVNHFVFRSEEHTSELQSRENLVCCLLLLRSLTSPLFPYTTLFRSVLSMIVYGIAFDFFNVSGSLFVDNETDKSIRSSAQGVFMMMTNGFGATIGMLAAGEIVNHFVF